MASMPPSINHLKCHLMGGNSDLLHKEQDYDAGELIN